MNIGDFADRIEQALGRVYSLPGHAVARIFVFVGDTEDVAYLSGELTAEDDDSLRGVLVLFTPTRVIRAELSGVADASRVEATGTVRVEAWSRSRIAAVSLPAGRGESEAWDNWPIKRWPNAARLVLTYVGNEKGREVVLPVGSRSTSVERTELMKLLPSLMADLGTAAPERAS